MGIPFNRRSNSSNFSKIVELNRRKDTNFLANIQPFSANFMFYGGHNVLLPLIGTFSVGAG